VSRNIIALFGGQFLASAATKILYLLLDEIFAGRKNWWGNGAIILSKLYISRRQNELYVYGQELP